MGARRDNRMKAARPLCIQNATGQAQDEYSLIVVGPGNGAEVESAAPTQLVKNEPKKKRAKTARPRCNRVSPVLDTGSPLEPWATASLSRLSRLIRSSSSSTSNETRTSRDSSPEKY